MRCLRVAVAGLFALFRRVGGSRGTNPRPFIPSRHPLVIALAALAVFSLESLYPEEITLALRLAKPYVYVSPSREIVGMEYDIIRSALAARGHTVKVEIYPLSRVIESARDGSVMAAAPVQESHHTGRYLSAVYIEYDNVAVALESRGYAISSPSGLRGKRVVAFQRASIALGNEYRNAVRESPEYAELPDQTAQVRMLFLGRTDVIVGDSRIFASIVEDPSIGVDRDTPLREFRIFPKTHYRVAFAIERYRDDFDAGLAEIRKNGTYDAIVRKYARRK